MKGDENKEEKKSLLVYTEVKVDLNFTTSLLKAEQALPTQIFTKSRRLHIYLIFLLHFPFDQCRKDEVQNFL